MLSCPEYEHKHQYKKKKNKKKKIAAKASAIRFKVLLQISAISVVMFDNAR